MSGYWEFTIIIFSKNILKDNENIWKYFYRILNILGMKIKRNSKILSGNKFPNVYGSDIMKPKNIPLY